MRERPNWNLKFKKNVKLDEDEIHTQLFQKIPLNVTQHYWGSLIKLNSTYMESRDVVYGQHGYMTMFSGLSFLAFFAGFLATIIITFKDVFIAHENFDPASLFPIFISFIAVVVFFLLLKIDLFKLSHMPVRLNRKTRLIHVMRYDGSVLTVPWDESFFNVGYGRYKGAFQRTFIAGHKMQDLKHWVDESFVLGGHTGTFDETYSLWEFFRRYMEDGPESALEGINEVVCLPLDRGKEPFSLGMNVIFFHLGTPKGLQFLICYPLVFLQTCCRWLAMRTCKVPVWPEGIEEMCEIEPNDPHRYDVTTNPPHARFGY